MKKRTSCSLIALLLLAGIAVSSCGEAAAEKTPADTQNASGETEEAVTEEPTEADLRAKIPDNLPEKDMNGYKFNIWVRNRGDFINDVGLELEESGDVVDDAILSRNNTVAERFNVEFDSRIIESGAFDAEVVKSIQSGDDACNLALGQIITISGKGIEGYFLDWYDDLPYVNLKQPWYIGNAAEACSVDGHAYIMIGEYDLDVLRFTYCMYFNKKIVQDYDIPNLYTTVADGKWTYDYLYNLSTQVYQDLDGDTKKSESDLLCISGDPYSAVVTYQYAFNNPLFTINDKGTPTMTFDTEKAHDIVVKLNELYWNTAGGYTQNWGTGSEAWNNGNLLFYTGLFQNFNSYRDLNFDFGIIPYPKYDEAQENYYTMSDGAHAGMVVPTTVSDPENTSIILEALNAETYKQVVPAYYDIALKVKYARDNESAEVLDLLMQSRVFDFGYMYNNDGSLAFAIQRLVSKNSNNTESEYAACMKKGTKLFEKVIAAYQELNG